MDPLTVVVLAAALVTLALALRVFADGPSILPSFWPAPPDVWPHGVQEDDDARWSWHRRPDPMKPVVERVRGRVRPGR